MVRAFSFAAFICIVSSAVEAASAANISVENIEGVPDPVILISGELERGDEQRFRRLALAHEKALVVLDSPGGAVVPALDIGRAIHISGYKTAVVDGMTCASACALIWLAGSTRGLSKGARLGFHASYRDENGVALESGAANALVGQYLTQLGLPAKAILFATLAPPNDFLWLNIENAELSGISFMALGGSDISDEKQSGGKSLGPDDLPNAPPGPINELDKRFSRFSKDWIAKKSARYGMDITPDGRIWFNADPYGDTDDYGVSADDLWTANGRFRKAWVRGYHKRNATVAFRESYQLVHADCSESKWGSELMVKFSPTGKVVDKLSAPVEWEPVIPRTYAESWHSMICDD